MHLEHYRFNLLIQQTIGILQRLELAFARGDGDFLHAQLRLRLLQRRLQFGLLAQKFAALLARALDQLLKFVQLRLQFGNLILAAKNGRWRFAVATFV